MNPDSLFPRIILQQPFGDVERIADRDVDVLMRSVSRRLAGDDLIARHLQIDSDVKRISRLMFSVRRLKNHPAGNDTGVKPLKPLGPLANGQFDRIGMRKVSK